MSEAVSYPEMSRAPFETSLGASDRKYLSEDEKRELLEVVRIGQEAQERLEAQEGIDDTAELQIAQKRGQRAEAIIVEAHTNLVWKIARSFHGNGMTVEDFVQEGRIGLLKATRTFDLSEDDSFQEYAGRCVKDALNLAIEKYARVIRLPKNEFWAAARMSKAQKTFLQNEGHYPGEEELATSANVSRQTLANLRSTVNDVVTVLDAPIWDDDSGSEKTLKDELLPETAEKNGDNTRDTLVDPFVIDLFSKLTKTQRAIFERKAGINGFPNMNQEEIASDLGVSSDHVKQTEKRARRRLRIIMGSIADVDDRAS